MTQCVIKTGNQYLDNVQKTQTGGVIFGDNINTAMLFNNSYAAMVYVARLTLPEENATNIFRDSVIVPVSLVLQEKVPA